MLLSTTLSPTKIQALNAALDRDRKRRGLSSDYSLAVAYGTTPRIISLWRNGKLTKLDRLLVDLLVPEPEPELVEV